MLLEKVWIGGWGLLIVGSAGGVRVDVPLWIGRQAVYVESARVCWTTAGCSIRPVLRCRCAYSAVLVRWG